MGKFNHRENKQLSIYWKGNGDFMRLRPFIADKDFDYLPKWVDDERVHALWCANIIEYPLNKDNLLSVLDNYAKDWGDCAFVATEDTGEPVGFFCYSINLDNNIGFLKFVIVDNSKRHMGYGQEMLRLALKYAFDITKAKAVQLNVFDVNSSAKHCYERLGFVQQRIDENAFTYKAESWNRINMRMCTTFTNLKRT